MTLTTNSVTDWRDIVCPPGPRRIATVPSAAAADAPRIARLLADLEREIESGDFPIDADTDLDRAVLIRKSLTLWQQSAQSAVVEFDAEACDDRVPPNPPSSELLEALTMLNRTEFNQAIASAQMEYIGVFEGRLQRDNERPVHVCYASIDKGAVSIPVDLLSDTTREFYVTHNHPNCAAFSYADFQAFCRFTSITELVAITVPYRYSFSRITRNQVIDEDEIEENIAYVKDSTKLQIDILATDNPTLAMHLSNGSANNYFSCDERGAQIWSDVTHSAWHRSHLNALDRYKSRGLDRALYLYSRAVIDRTAEGKFGTADINDVLLLANQAIGRKSSVSGLSENENVVDSGSGQRHKAPYRDDDFAPAHDAARAFPDIYSLPFSRALGIYGDGTDADAEALQIIRNIHNKPDAKVKIYRAVQKGLRDSLTDLKQDRRYMRDNSAIPPWADVPVHSASEYSEFVEYQVENLGSVDGVTIQPSIGVRDWVTLTRRYAEDHGELAIPGGYTIISKVVKAKDLFTDGNSIHEWGYDPAVSTGEPMEGITFHVPELAQREATRGLQWRREFNRGGTEVGVARARDLSNGRKVSLETIKRIKAYFDRHQVDKDAEGFRLGENGYPSAGRIAWALWGGDAAYTWAKNILAKHGGNTVGDDTSYDFEDVAQIGADPQTVENKGLSDNDTMTQVNTEPADMDSKVPDTTAADPMNVAPLTTNDIVSMDPPESLPLTGEMREFLTNLLAKFNMLIWGGPGSGKSSFVLRLANELAETDTGRVLYYMTEEKVASGRLKARMDLMKAYSANINFDDAGTIDRLTALVNTGEYRYVIIDSINMLNTEQQKIVELMQTFPEISWIFIAQATKGKNAYLGIQALAHAVDTEIATSNDKGNGMAELRKHRDGPLKSHTIFGSKGLRDPGWKKSW